MKSSLLTAIVCATALSANPVDRQSSLKMNDSPPSFDMSFMTYTPVITHSEPDITIVHYDVSHDRSSQEELVNRAGVAYNTGDLDALDLARTQSAQDLFVLQNKFESIDEYFTQHDVVTIFVESEGKDDVLRISNRVVATPHFSLHAYIQKGGNYTKEDVFELYTHYPQADLAYGNFFLSGVKKVVLFKTDDSQIDVQEINLLERIVKRDDVAHGPLVPIVTFTDDIDFENIVRCMNDSGDYVINLVEYEPILDQIYTVKE